MVVDALPDDFNDLELFARVHSLVRLNTMREELDRRFETTAKFIAQPPLLNLPEITSSNARIVLVGSDSDFLGNITSVLPAWSPTTRFDEPYQALAGLTEDPQDALIVAASASSWTIIWSCSRESGSIPACTICRW